MKNELDFLNIYKNYLQEVKLESEIFNAGPNIDSLTYAYKGKYFINIFFIPDADFDNLSLLQFTCLLNCSDFLKNNQLILLKLLNKMNTSLPIGSIIYTEESQILFKYICASQVEQPLEAKLFHEFVNLLNYIIEDNSKIFMQNSEEVIDRYISHLN